jgi:uncharacterized membrane protein
MENKIRDVNKEHRESLTKLEKIAVFITNHVGTVEFAIFCAVFVTIPLVWKNTMPVILYISSGYMQLILLPLIMVGQNLQNRHAERRVQSEYELSLKSEAQIKDIVARLEKQDLILKDILEKIK